MPSDLSKTSDDLRQHYKAVVMQQGRVLLDRDFNALQEIINGRIAADALDEIGPCGTPDDGFAISLLPVGWSGPSGWSYSAPNPLDFLISPGTMYVGGQRFVLPVPDTGQPPWSYFHQPDWINPDDPAAFGSTPFSGPAHEFVYLYAFEQEVGAIEDSDLLDVALGGPDTTQRVRLMGRVLRMPVAATDCAGALAEAENDWLQKGFLFDPVTMRLRPLAALQVSFTSLPSTSNPCDPVAQGGYLGAENQLIRAQVSDPVLKGQARLLWGYDNASFLYRVTVKPDGQTLLLNQAPVDAFHCPKPGQVVEVLRTAAILGTEPDVTDPTGQRTIVRCVAEATGMVATVATYSNSDNTVVLKLDSPLQSDPNPMFLRVWQGQQTFDPSSSQPITLVDPTDQTSPGIQVTVTIPADGVLGGALPVGAFWMIAVRPSTPQAVYPERFLTSPQPPDGPRQWVCPLAVLEWNDAGLAQIHDCRRPFYPLTGPRAIHVVASNPSNDEVVALANFTGIQITLDIVPFSPSVSTSPLPSSPTMIVLLEMPLPISSSAGIVTQLPVAVVLSGTTNIDPQNNMITWTPSNDSKALFASGSQLPLRVRVTLRGHTIWAIQGDRRLYLDGQAFGFFAAGPSRIDLVLPSGAGAVASDFESWFYLSSAAIIGATTTMVTSSAQISVFGQSVTFTAAVSVTAPGGGIPSGSVQFQIDRSNFGGPASLTGGVSSTATSSLSAGNHTILAVYSGDPNFNVSTGTLTQTVNKANTTLTAASSAPAPGPTAFSTNLTATVSVQSPGAGTPTNPVSFSVASSAGQLATQTAQLVSGVASVQIITNFQPTSGTAVYNGDSNFNGSMASFSVPSAAQPGGGPKG
jgi:hypothetical protein